MSAQLENKNNSIAYFYSIKTTTKTLARLLNIYNALEVTHQTRLAFDLVRNLMSILVIL